MLNITTNINQIVAKHGITKVHALIECLPANQMLGILFAMEKYGARPMLCSIVETTYRVDEGFKIEFSPLDAGFENRIMYQSDFDSTVKAGHIKLFIEI